MRSYLSSAQNIAVFRALQLGDILCSIPALRALRNAKPNANITFIGMEHTKDLIGRFAKYIDDFIVFPGYLGLPEQPYDEEKFGDFCAAVAAKKFDLMLQMQGNGNIVNPMLRSLKIGQLVGFCRFAHEEDECLLTYPETPHEILRHLHLMRHLGIEDGDTELEFEIAEHDEKDFEKLRFPYRDGAYLVIHPGSRGDWRQWPPLYFAAIADHCINHGFSVVLTGTPSEKKITDQVASMMQNRCINLCGRTNLGTMAVLLRKSHGLISNCTGVSHLAAALKKPSVVISMDGEPHRWAPLNQELHHTIDWCTTPDYRLVLSAVDKLINNKLS